MAKKYVHRIIEFGPNTITAKALNQYGDDGWKVCAQYGRFVTFVKRIKK